MLAESSAAAMAVFMSTPSAPSSMAMAASDAVPTPASTMSGTAVIVSRMIRRLALFCTPMPEPIGAASGMTAAAPASISLRAFTAAFGSPDITAEKIGLALEQFVLTLTSFDSKFDRAMSGKDKLTADEQRGFELFMTEYAPRTGQFGADCFHCHGGATFSTQ